MFDFFQYESNRTVTERVTILEQQVEELQKAIEILEREGKE